MKKSRSYSVKKSLKPIKISYELEDNSSNEISELKDNSDEDYEISNLKQKIKKDNNTKQKSKLEMLQNYEKKMQNKSPESIDNFWKEWEKIQKMRGSYIAAVDTMGVEYCADSKQDRAIYKFQTLISLLLSSQTKDPITFAVMNKLIKHGLTVENIIKTDEDTIRDMIYGVSFHNNKTKFIKKVAEIIRDKYNSNTPEKYEDIINLPGIGPKMAHLYIQCVCDRIEGIAVDTHVHRICNRLKWTNNTKTPEHTRKELESWLPQKYWADINYLLVGFGQTICKATGAKCEECLLKTTCEYGIKRLKEKSKKKSKNSKSKSTQLVDIDLDKINLESNTNDEEVKKSSLKRKSKRKNVDPLENNLLANNKKKK